MAPGGHTARTIPALKTPGVRKATSMAAHTLKSVLPVAVDPIILVNEYLAPRRLVQANSKWKVLDQHKNTDWMDQVGYVVYCCLEEPVHLVPPLLICFRESLVGIMGHCL